MRKYIYTLLAAIAFLAVSPAFADFDPKAPLPVDPLLTQEQFDSCHQQPLNLKFHVADHNDGEATYFRDFLRRYMMAKEPRRADYQAWNMVKYHIDSINWENDPLYGWCNKNRKKNGETYNVYTDGLKVFTTIDSRMQEYAEQAVHEHVAKFLQPAFTKEKRGRKS